MAIACFAFAIQIYCDFSGYTDIARGVAKLMGFEFMLNFNLPYFAQNPQDFWRRWHISLSTWLRDYLYFSLGGGRGSTAMVYRNPMLTMVIGGLWHGAAWNFALWGGYHGGLLVGHRLAKPWLDAWLDWPGKWGAWASTVFCTAAMFVLTCYGWLLFRATSLDQVVQMTLELAAPLRGFDADLAKTVAAYSLPLLAWQALEFRQGQLDLFKAWKLPGEARAFCYGVIAYLVVFRGGLPQSFIYFQF